MVERVERRISPEEKLKREGFRRVGTTALIRSRDGRYLLVEENQEDWQTGKEAGVWSFPSEKAKVGENFLTTLIRGLTEELGPEMLKQLWLERKCFLGEAGVVLIRARLVSLYFDGDPTQLVFSSSEIAKFRWFSSEEILNGTYNLRPGMKEIFTECLSRGLLPEGKFGLSRNLGRLPQNLTMVPEDTPDIAL